MRGGKIYVLRERDKIEKRETGNKKGNIRNGKKRKYEKEIKKEREREKQRDRNRWREKQR